jgi:hypothetical protein
LKLLVPELCPSIWTQRLTEQRQQNASSVGTAGRELHILHRKAQSEVVASAATRRPTQPRLLFACPSLESRHLIGSRG